VAGAAEFGAEDGGPQPPGVVPGKFKLLALDGELFRLGGYLTGLCRELLLLPAPGPGRVDQGTDAASADD
jgi:hypothetical protein